ncbi:MAG: serine/threonine-protein kinase [Myxococcota bacterium]
MSESRNPETAEAPTVRVGTEQTRGRLDSTTQTREVASPEAKGVNDEPGAAPWHSVGSSLSLSTVTLAPEQQGDARLPVPVSSRLGRYLVMGMLGRGGMGTVLEAYDESLERSVAVKLLHSGTTAQEAQRLRREALALARLSHPNVVQVYEVGQADGRWFIAMELVPGQTLRRWQRGGHDWRQSVEAYLQAGRGLAAAHAVGLVHRDFKPDNCIIDDQGRVRVLDFGLVHHSTDPSDFKSERAHAESQEMDTVSGESKHDADRVSMAMVPITSVGTVMGTPGYMALEHLEGKETDARSDQFAFCASLYEALYGERPYKGRSMPELVTTMRERQFRPVPKGIKVPTKLRTALQRGLAADPEARWPSMEALLVELQRLAAPHRVLRTAIWSVGIAAGLGLLGVGLMVQASREQVCNGAQAQMEGIWDDARREAVEVAILETERPHAADTWDRIGLQLNVYADSWMHAHTEVCEATSVRGEQSRATMDLRMRCLGQRRTALRAAVDMLVDADATVVDHAGKLVTGLPPLSPCDDLSWLQEQDMRAPPPEDPDVATRVEAQRTRLAEIEAMVRAGRHVEALEQVEAVVPQAEALDYAPLLAESLQWRGQLRTTSGQYAQAEQDLRHAHTLAVEHHQDAVALDTALGLILVVGHHLERHIEGRQWGEMVARPLAQRIGDPTKVATNLNHLGLVSYDQGKYEDATRYYQQALEMRAQALGSDHPDTADVRDHLGMVFERRGEYEEARQHYQRALEIRESALGANHPDVAYSLLGLAKVVLKAGEPVSARAYAERALSIREAATVTPELRAEAHFVLARALWSDEDQRRRARALAELARDTLAEQSPNSQERLDPIEAWLTTHRVQ